MPGIEFELTNASPMGKNFRARNSSKARKGDLYETPYSLTRQLLEVENFRGMSILEPAAGNGAICRVLEESGYGYFATDIAHGDDFLTHTVLVDSIITNPPYSLALEFVLHAKEVCRAKFAFLLPLTYLHGTQRLEFLFGDTTFPLAKVWVFTRQMDLRWPIREDGKHHSGAIVFAWFVWDRHHSGAPQIGWINNQKHVLKAGE